MPIITTQKRGPDPAGMKALKEAVQELMQDYTDVKFQQFVEGVYKNQIQCYDHPETFQFVIRNCVNLNPIATVTCFQFFGKFIQECAGMDQNDLVFALEAAFNANRTDLIVHLLQKKRLDKKFQEMHNLSMSFVKMAFKVKRPVETMQKLLDYLSNHIRNYWSPCLFEHCLRQTSENKIFWHDMAAFLASWNVKNIFRDNEVLYFESSLTDVDVFVFREFVSWCLDQHYFSLAVYASFLTDNMAWFSEMLAKMNDDVVMEVFQVGINHLTPTHHFISQARDIIAKIMTGFTEENIQRCLFKLNDFTWNDYLVWGLCQVFCSMGFTKLCLHLWLKVGRMDKVLTLPFIWKNTGMVDYTLHLVIASGTLHYERLFEDYHCRIKGLVEKCSGDPSLLAGLLKCATTEGDVDIVKTFLRKFDPPQCGNTLAKPCQRGSFLRGDADEKTTRLCIKAGLSTWHTGCQKGVEHADQENQLLVALKKNNLAVAKLLLDSGAVSNYHFHEARVEMQGNAECVELLKTVEMPHSLTSLCCWDISHLIGGGPQRQRKIEELESFLPSMLVYKVAFQGICEEQRLKRKGRNSEQHSKRSKMNNEEGKGI